MFYFIMFFNSLSQHISLAKTNIEERCFESVFLIGITKITIYAVYIPILCNTPQLQITKTTSVPSHSLILSLNEYDRRANGYP